MIPCLITSKEADRRLEQVVLKLGFEKDNFPPEEKEVDMYLRPKKGDEVRTYISLYGCFAFIEGGLSAKLLHELNIHTVSYSAPVPESIYDSLDHCVNITRFAHWYSAHQLPCSVVRFCCKRKEFYALIKSVERLTLEDINCDDVMWNWLTGFDSIEDFRAYISNLDTPIIYEHELYPIPDLIIE